MAQALGTEYDFMPIPPDLSKCTAIKSDKLTFLVEERVLTDDMAREAYLDNPAAMKYYDGKVRKAKPPRGGVSIHVMSNDDGKEYLRFDCFPEDPHYHYVQHAKNINLWIPYDDTANGDVLQWALGRLGGPLPGMLRKAGAGALAEKLDMKALQPALKELAAVAAAKQ